MEIITNLLIPIMLLIICIGFYMIPGSIAYNRKTGNKKTILLTNIFLAWFPFVWIVLIIVAMASKTEKDIERENELIELQKEFYKKEFHKKNTQ